MPIHDLTSIVDDQNPDSNGVPQQLKINNDRSLAAKGTYGSNNEMLVSDQMTKILTDILTEIKKLNYHLATVTDMDDFEIEGDIDA